MNVGVGRGLLSDGPRCELEDSTGLAGVRNEGVLVRRAEAMREAEPAARAASTSTLIIGFWRFGGAGGARWGGEALIREEREKELESVCGGGCGSVGAGGAGTGGGGGCSGD